MVTAAVNSAGNGISISNPVQGSQMTISENGGTSAADLGVQTFNAQTPLSQLNGGQGVSIASSGNDFTITTASNGTQINVALAARNDGSRTSSTRSMPRPAARWSLVFPPRQTELP